MDISKQLKKYQEGLIAAALRSAFPTQHHLIHWNQSFGAYFIDPDITYGPADAPRAIFCIAHSDSEKESDKKFWRNAAELCLSKGRLPNRPVLVNIVFEDAYKPALLEAMIAAFDVHIGLRDIGCTSLLSAGPELISKGLRNVQTGRPTIEYLEGRFLKRSPYKEEFAVLIRSVEASVKRSRRRHTAYWDALRETLPGDQALHELGFQATGALRRGISKLLCFEPEDRERVFEGTTVGIRQELPVFAFGLGWAQKTLRRGYGVVADEDLRLLSSAFQYPVVSGVIDSIPENVMAGLTRVAILPCREFGSDALTYSGVFKKRAAEFADPLRLSRLIDECFADPGFGQQVRSENRWILDFGLAAGKAAAGRAGEGRAQGYGLSQLAGELECDEPDKVRFWVPDYNLGRQNLLPEVRDAISVALARKFSVLIERDSDIEDVAQHILKWMRHTLVEVKLCTYRLFKPAEILFCSAARSAGFTVTDSSLATSPIFSNRNAVVGTQGLLLTKGKKSVFVKVQSGSKNTHDKAKELAGRIGLSLVESGAAYEPQYQSSLLVLDGPFSEMEARLCYAAGWRAVAALDQLSGDFFRLLGEDA